MVAVAVGALGQGRAALVALVVVIGIGAVGQGGVTDIALVVVVAVGAGVTRFFRGLTCNRYLSIGRRGYGAGLAVFIIIIARAVSSVIRSQSTLTPHVVGTCRGEDDLGVAAFVGRDRALGFTVDRAVIDLEVRGLLHPGYTVHQIAEGVHQLDGQRLSRLCLVIMDVVSVLVGKQVEASQLIPQEGVAPKAGHVQEIAVLQNDTVGGGADGIPTAVL